jgi:hypothetical protein
MQGDGKIAASRSAAGRLRVAIIFRKSGKTTKSPAERPGL